MKKLILIAVITLGALVTFGPLAQAADTPPAEGSQKNKARADTLARMTRDLGLSAEQQAKLKPGLEADAKKVKEVTDDTTLSREDRRAKITTIREESAKRIKDSKILTPEQQAKWEKLNAERAKKQKKAP